MLDIVYVSAGLSSSMEQLSAFPKALIPIYDDDSIFLHNFKLFNKIFDGKVRQSIIVNEIHYNMMRRYVDLNLYGYDVSIHTTKFFNGSFNCIVDSFREWWMMRNRALYIWGDIVLSKQAALEIIGTIEKFKENNILFLQDGKYSYRHENDSIYHTAIAGNIPGIYYLDDKFFSTDEQYVHNPSYTKYLPEELKIDVVNKITPQNVPLCYTIDNKIFSIEQVSDLHDYVGKKVKITNGRLDTTIVEEEEYIKKFCKDSTKISKELQWYEEANKYIQNLIPKVVSSKEMNCITFEKLQGYYTLFELINETRSSKYLLRALEAINKMHASHLVRPSRYVVLNDIAVEFIDRPMKRIMDCHELITNFSGEALKNLEKALQKAYNKIVNYYSNQIRDSLFEYSFIHGDLNGSNILINPKTDDVKFIDPRGMFGATQFFGLREYDYSKIYYFLDGYDNFNSHYYLYRDDDHFERPVSMGLKQCDNKIIQIMSAIHFISLSSLVANNIMKVNIACTYGFEKLGELLNEDEN